MDRTFTVGVLSISDKGSQGMRTDASGPTAVSILEKEGFNVVRQEIVPDNRRRIADTLKEWADKD